MKINAKHFFLTWKTKRERRGLSKLFWISEELFNLHHGESPVANQHKCRTLKHTSSDSGSSASEVSSLTFQRSCYKLIFYLVVIGLAKVLFLLFFTSATCAFKTIYFVLCSLHATPCSLGILSQDLVS